MQVALVVLVLINIGINLYILKQLLDYKTILNDEVEHIECRVERQEKRQNMFEDGIAYSLNRIHKGMINIPKEISVKNVLSLP